MSKRKILLVAMSLCMVAILAVGTTLAYMTDTDVTVNTFKTGKVGLTLDEAPVQKNEETGDYEAQEGDRVHANEYADVYPGNVLDKDPTIVLDSDSKDAWVAAKIVITGAGVYELFQSGYGDYLDITKDDIITGGLIDKTSGNFEEWEGMLKATGAGFVIAQDANKAANTWTLYLYLTEIQSAGDDTVLFEKITIPDTWKNQEMEWFDGMSIDITAYAVQADGFATCQEAMGAAFGAGNVDGNPDAGFPVV